MNRSPEIEKNKSEIKAWTLSLETKKYALLP